MTTSPISTDRAILSVVGPHSGSGKTAFVTTLLRRFGGLACLKISPAPDWRADTVVGAEVEGRNFYLEDLAGLVYAGSDTALYLDAGAVEVRRLRHRADGLRAGLTATLERYPAGVPVVVESSSAVKFLSPCAVLLVTRPPIREMKPSTAAILPRVTDLLLNTPEPERPAAETAAALLVEFPALQPQHTWCADLGSEDLPADLMDRISDVLR